MKPSLLQALGQPLSVHATLVGMGIDNSRALQIITNHKDLSFKPKYMSLTQTFRDQLKAIAVSIDVNINSLLNMLSTDQIQQVIADHSGIRLSDPDSDEKDKCMQVDGLTKDSKGTWWIELRAHGIGSADGSYELHSLEIEDVLALMQTIENCIDPTINNQVLCHEQL